MWKTLLLAAIVSMANVAEVVYAQAECAKCCGILGSPDVSHRTCSFDRYCHVTECGIGIGPGGGCCWSIGDAFRDICGAVPADGEIEDYESYHDCPEE